MPQDAFNAAVSPLSSDEARDALAFEWLMQALTRLAGGGDDDLGELVTYVSKAETFLKHPAEFCAPETQAIRAFRLAPYQALEGYLLQRYRYDEAAMAMFVPDMVKALANLRGHRPYDVSSCERVYEIFGVMPATLHAAPTMQI